MNIQCQIHIVQEYSDLQEMITLSLRSNGYPQNMIPLIHRAWIKANDEYYSFAVGRTMVVVDVLYSTDPRGFEWEDNYLLGGNILYYYEIHCWYSDRKDQPVWKIDIYERNCPFFKYDFTLADFKRLESRQNIEDLVKKYNVAEPIKFSAIK
jgi:hypothetical protein